MLAAVSLRSTKRRRSFVSRFERRTNSPTLWECSGLVSYLLSALWLFSSAVGVVSDAFVDAVMCVGDPRAFVVGDHTATRRHSLAVSLVMVRAGDAERGN